MTDALAVIGQHVQLTGRLFLRFGLMLTAIWAGAAFLDQLLLRLAVEIGIQNRLLGLVAISPIILLQLVVFVSFFVILRNDLPQLRRRRRQAATTEDMAPLPEGERSSSVFGFALLAVLLPFYGYYAGWGLLGDTLRSYSQVFHATQLTRVDFTKPERVPTALEVGQTGWVVLAVALIWMLRRFAKRRNDKSGGRYWIILIVACEATWALLGLYVVSGWRDQFASWLATLPSPSEVMGWMLPAAAAAITEAAQRPVDWPPTPQIIEILTHLFWYALLPLQWLGSAIAVAGVLIVSVDSLSFGTAPVWAYVLTMASMLVFALASVLRRGKKVFDMPVHQSICIHTLTGAVLFGICAVLQGDGLQPPMTRNFAIGMVWLVLIATFGAYSIYYTSLRLFPASRVSAAIYLSPPVTMIWAWGLFSEPLTIAMFIGLAVTLLGVWLTSRE